MSRYVPGLSRVAVIPTPNKPIELRTYRVPAFETGSALLRTIASEVCGTDVHLWHGKLAGVPYPLIPGHVSVGELEHVEGAIVDCDGTPLAIGDVVTFLDVVGTCNACWYCLVAKSSTRCPKRKVYGITLGADDQPGLAGGWSEAIYLRPGTKVLKLPNTVSPDTWIGGGCGLPTAVHAVELARLGLADRVLIQGSGPVGLSCAALALLSGASWVGVIGAPAERLAAAKRMGVDFTLDVTQTTIGERRAAILDACSFRGPDIIIEASGNPVAVSEGCDLVRDAGRYVIVGQYTDNGPVEINPHLQINKKHLEVQGCWGSDFSHVYRALAVQARFDRQMHWDQLISRRYNLEDAETALRDVQAGRVVKAVILPQ